MHILVKKIISTILLFCFSTTIFHLHPHTHNQTSIGGKIVNQDNELNHHDSDECEKCLTKNNRIVSQYPANKLLNNSLIQPKYQSKNFTKYVLNFSIYSRPPPFDFL